MSLRKTIIQADDQMAAAASTALPDEIIQLRLATRLRAMLVPNPRGELGLRSHKDSELVDNLAWSLTTRLGNGTLSEAGVADDLHLNRSTLYRNLRDRFGLTFRALERFARQE